MLFRSRRFSPPGPPSPPAQSLGLNIKESVTTSSQRSFTRVHGFKNVAGGVQGPPELAGLIKEGDVFIGVSCRRRAESHAPRGPPLLPPCRRGPSGQR